MSAIIIKKKKQRRIIKIAAIKKKG